MKDNSNIGKPPVPPVPRSPTNFVRNIILSDNRGPVIVSVSVSSAGVGSKDKTLAKKPARLSKRAVSLPANLQSADLPTKDLFWFLPNKRHRGRCCSERENPSKIPTERAIGVLGTHASLRPQPLPENATPCCVTTSSAGSVLRSSPANLEERVGDTSSDADEQDCPLLGLDIIESQTESEINENDAVSNTEM